MSVRASAPTQGLILLAPALLVYCLFAVYPMLDVAALSFMKWNELSPTKQVWGLDNYVQVFTQDPVFWQAVRNTVLWTVMSVIPTGDRLCSGARAEPKHSRTKPAARALLLARHHRAYRRRDHVAVDVRPVLWAV